jgi:DNA invertase Pin-like site-specific DNA recombinase
MRAAQYVRMSTEHQQFSIENQKAVIAEYANSHDFEIVHTYSDEARSGIDLVHRPGLKRLLADIEDSRADFRAVLVYDVSRWGRFQDADESACYEFLCRRAGVNVIYCAEPFANDLGVVASLMKTLKRTMAAEYLRELSDKVFAGQCRLVRKGFKAGGVAGYGLRRLLLTAEGKPKTILRHGERKSLVTERVTYTLGTANEVRTVRKIYSLFLDAGLNCEQIARSLNENRIPYPRGLSYHRKSWNGQIIKGILTHPRYTGAAVFNRKSQRLRSKAKWNPREQWVIQANSFPAIISRERFDAAQRQFGDRVSHRSNERLLNELRSFVRKHGRVTQLTLAEDPSMATACTYSKRFGSFSRALVLAVPEPVGGLSEIERRARLKLRLQDDLAESLAAQNIKHMRKNGVFRSSAHNPLLVDVACCRVLKNGELRWEIRYPLTGIEGLSCITQRLDADNDLPLDYVLIRSLPPGNQRYRFSEERIRSLGSIHNSLGSAVKEFLTK